MTSRLARVLLLSLTAGAAAACGGSDEPSPGAKNGASEGTIATGRYELTTEVDLTQVSDWTETVDETLAPLEKLRENPAKAFLDSLGDAPVVTAIRDKIPDSLESKFAGWFNADALGGKLDDLAAPDALSGIRSSLSSMLGKFEIVSTLDVKPDGEAADHTVKGLAFTAGDERVLVDAPDLVKGLPGAEKIEILAKGGETKLGAHSFSLPIGDFSARGLDLLDTDKLLRAGLKFALSRIIKCGEIAESVSNKCVVGICVGHEQEIEQLCDKGLDKVVDLTVGGMKKLKIDPLKLVGGNLTIADALVPGGLSGVWNGSVDLGKGERVIESVFKGRKL